MTPCLNWLPTPTPRSELTPSQPAARACCASVACAANRFHSWPQQQLEGGGERDPRPHQASRPCPSGTRRGRIRASRSIGANRSGAVFGKSRALAGSGCFQRSLALRVRRAWQAETDAVAFRVIRIHEGVGDFELFDGLVEVGEVDRVGEALSVVKDSRQSADNAVS